MMSTAALRKAIEALHPLTDADWAAFAPLVQPLSLARGAFFVEAGAPSRDLAFLASGLMRAYYATPDGAEMTTNFCGEGAFVSAYPSALAGQPARASIQALEDCELLRFEVAAFRALFVRFPAWNHVGRLLVEAYIVFQERRIADLLTLDAAARYAAFKASHAAILPRLQRQQIAAYLGISREALSRLGRR